MRTVRMVALIVFAFAPSARAQQQATAKTVNQPEFVVKTVPLHHLSSNEAVKLLSPYAQTVGGGVFEVSPNVRAVTIREVQKVYNEMMTVLAQYDREPASVTLTFQLVAADNTTARDPGVAGVDSVLRTVLKYSGYRLLSSAVATASENGLVSQAMQADSEILNLSVGVSDLRIEGNDASVHLNVELRRPAAIMLQGTALHAGSVLGTGVTVPIGQTIVLGTAASTTGTQRALILTVRPQLVSATKR